MKFLTNEQRGILGLSPKEGRLIEALHKHTVLNTSELAHHTSLPRVTTMRLLKGLLARGFVSRKEKGKFVLWSTVTKDVFKKQFDSLFDSGKDTHFFAAELSEVGSLRLYHGIEAMIESNRRMLVAHPGERVLAVEPNAIWKHFAKVQSKEVHELNLLWGTKKILVEIVAEEGFEEVIKSHIAPDIESSFLSLAIDIRVVPKGVLDSSTEILIFRDQVLFLDWAHLVAVEIQNPSTTRVLKAMFRMLQKSGRSYR